jgi:hypothetical protein
MLDELPTLDKLLIFKYTSKGVRKKLEIIDSACHKWKDIASLICSDANILTVLEMKYPRDPKECLRQVFIHNFIEGKPQRYSQDWNGLIELLDDIELEKLAEELRYVISLESGGEHHEVSIHSTIT